MPDVPFDNLFAVSLVAFVVPFALGFVPRLRVPSVVVEILVGVALGPTLLGWVRVDEVVAVLAALGLGFLLFLAGLEIDVRALGGPTLRTAGLGYAVTIALGLAVGLALQSAGWVRSGLLSATGGAAATVALLSAFAVLAVVVALAVGRAGRSMHLGDVLDRLQDTTAEIRVRAAVVLFVGFVALASRFGIETILGAFVAGAVVATVDRDAASHPHFRTKLEALGYGFLVPVFFVASGVRLDLRGLFADPAAALRVPVLLLALLLVRGAPALLFRRALGGRATAAAALLQATSLPFLVATAQLGTATGAMSSVTAAALVCAGVLSVLVFPATALGLLRGATVDRVTARR